MIVTDLSNSFHPVPKSGQKRTESSLKTGQIRKKGKKHRQTKATKIPKWVKEIVWNRDGHKCISCGRYVPKTCANAHFIKRSQGGLGIPENIVTLCPKCHYEEDFGKDSKVYWHSIENYLKGIYGINWDKSKLVYKKY